MPKIVTLEERRKNEVKRFYRSQDSVIRCNLKDAKKDKEYNLNDITGKTGISINTVRKVFDNPQKATLEQLRDVCNALGLRVTICAE